MGNSSQIQSYREECFCSHRQYDLLRGDIQILQGAFKLNQTVVDVIAMWLDFILNAIKNFDKAVSKEDK